MWVPVFADDARVEGEAVLFTCKLLDRRIPCRIDAQVLRAELAAADDDLVAIFAQNRERIQDKIRHKIRMGRYEADGSIVIKPGDLQTEGGALLKPKQKTSP